jgi:hypothetical protein
MGHSPHVLILKKINNPDDIKKIKILNEMFFIHALTFQVASRKMLDPKFKDKGSVVEEFPSGQREQTVNLPALPSKVRILPPPP